MDIVTRLKQFMDYTQLPSSQFADQAQIPRPTLSQIMNGRNKKISNELITKLHEYSILRASKRAKSFRTAGARYF
jgi:predicted transcriptional regulator